ncbi:MAG: hypothetical protein GC136_05710 [Alphaproteobacteria bacterium]|nr:hypothetical protein [Alphaproteobacteria bacterium]
MAGILKEKFTSPGFQFGDTLSSRGSDIAEAFAEAAEVHIDDIRNPIFFHEIERARLSVTVNKEQPNLTYPFAFYRQHGLHMEEGEFYQTIQEHITEYVYLHNLSWSGTATLLISLRVDDKKPKMSAPTKTFEFIMEAK